ncbi:MAG: hypothetical protein AB9907_14795 [Flexilinea sp.]
MDKKMIDVTVPVSVGNKFCGARKCGFCYFGSCALFMQFLDKADERGLYLKCQACLDAPEHEEYHG